MNQSTHSDENKKSLLRAVVECIGLLTLIGAGLGAAYRIGKEVRDGEASKSSAAQYSKHSAEITSLNARISTLTTNLSLSQSKQESAESAAAQWKAAYDALLVQLESEQKSRQSLTLALGKADNCAFIHEQIRSLQMEIRNSTLVWMSADGRAREKERREPLELQIQRYQEQLGTCNR